MTTLTMDIINALGWLFIPGFLALFAMRSGIREVLHVTVTLERQRQLARPQEYYKG